MGKKLTIKIMTKLVKETELNKRIKTFGWSLFWVILASTVDHVLSNLGFLNLPTLNLSGIEVNMAVILGLVLNQISKYAHKMRMQSK